MIAIMEPPIFAVMGPVKRVKKGSSNPHFYAEVAQYTLELEARLNGAISRGQPRKRPLRGCSQRG